MVMFKFFRVGGSVLVALGAVFLGCGGSGGSSNPNSPPPIVLPDGDDNVVALANANALEFGQTYTALAVTKKYVYACVPAFGMQVGTLNGPGELTLTVTEGLFPSGTGCRAITTGPDGMVFMAGQATDGGSWIASMADGAATSNGELPLHSVVSLGDGMVEDLLATDTHVYVVLGDAGLRVLSRDGGNLSEVAQLVDGFDQALGLAMHGTHTLIVGNGPAGLAVVDVLNPSAPAITNTFKTYGVGRKVDVSGDFAFVAAVGGGVSVHDLTQADPYPPVASWPTHSSTMDISVTDAGLAFVANWEDLVVLDVSVPQNIQFLASEVITTGGGSSKVVGVVGRDDVAYVADWSTLATYMYVEGRSAPDIHLSKTKLKFGLVSLKKGKAILVENFGSEPLEVSNIQSDNPLFQVDVSAETMVINPGGIDYLEIVFEPVDDSEVKAHLTMTTNDPDESLVDIPLSANVISGKQLGGPFDGDEPMIYLEVDTGKDVTVMSEHAGKVVLLAYFATW